MKNILFCGYDFNPDNHKYQDLKISYLLVTLLMTLTNDSAISLGTSS